MIDKNEGLVGGRRNCSISGVGGSGVIFSRSVCGPPWPPLILVRKMGKLPNKVFTKSFELEYGCDVVCVQEVDIHKGSRVLLVDDLIATGGTLKAAASMFEEHGAQVAGFLGVIGLPFLKYEQALAPYPVEVLQVYHGE